MMTNPTLGDVERWLKSLRLHKYSALFARLTYQQMLDLSEEYLIAEGVTKGARNKMLASIKKLKLRTEVLNHMIDDISSDSISIKEALTQLKDMLVTPMRTNEDLPQLYLTTLDIVAKKLIHCPNADLACRNQMHTLVDECLKHVAFSSNPKHRELLERWRFDKRLISHNSNHSGHDNSVAHNRHLNHNHNQHHSYNGYHQQQQQQPQQLLLIQNQQQKLQHQQQQQQLHQQPNKPQSQKSSMPSRFNHYHHHSHHQSQYSTASNHLVHNSSSSSFVAPHRNNHHSVPYPIYNTNNKRDCGFHSVSKPQVLARTNHLTNSGIYHNKFFYNNDPMGSISPSSESLSSESLSSTGSVCSSLLSPSDSSSGEYSLLAPTITFELDCLKTRISCMRYDLAETGSGH